jgi:hypothetical protein
MAGKYTAQPGKILQDKRAVHAVHFPHGFHVGFRYGFAFRDHLRDDAGYEITGRKLNDREHNEGDKQKCNPGQHQAFKDEIEFLHLWHSPCEIVVPVNRRHTELYPGSRGITSQARNDSMAAYYSI